MLSLVIVQLLAFDPAETYGALSVEPLLEKKRLLLEERPTFVAPTLVILTGFAATASGGATLGAAFTGPSRGCSSFGGSDSLCIGGGVATAVGVAAFTFGLVWLLRRIELWKVITARVGEIDGLVAYKTATAAPRP
jgi:hypothetical protein